MDVLNSFQEYLNSLLLYIQLTDLPNREEEMATIIKTEKLKKSYKMGKLQVHALNGVDLEIEEGEFAAILGPSGSGKSTLLNMLGALDKPTSGTIEIDQIDLFELGDKQLSVLRRRIGFVFQFFNLIDRLTATENVALPLAIENVNKKKRHKIAEELLQTVGLGKRTQHKPNELSGGECQRVAIARALINKPHFLLMDEPTGNIDSKTAKDLMRLITQLNEEKNVTIVMVTHDTKIATSAHRILHLLDGKILSKGDY